MEENTKDATLNNYQKITKEQLKPLKRAVDFELDNNIICLDVSDFLLTYITANFDFKKLLNFYQLLSEYIIRKTQDHVLTEYSCKEFLNYFKTYLEGNMYATEEYAMNEGRQIQLENCTKLLEKVKEQLKENI